MTQKHTVVSKEDWIAARKLLLAREKEYTRAGDALAAQRRELPWERVDKRYVFQTDAGAKTLAELFEGKHQLAVYHFMFAPSWDVGCKSCSFWADHFNGIVAHLAQRDVRFVAISRAPLPKLQAYAKRMGWTFPWVSSSETDFNFDYRVSFRPEDTAAGTRIYNYAPSNDKGEEETGISMFYQDDSGDVFHTYSAYGRGVELANATYRWLDIAPKGRDESSLEWPMAWVRLHDEYPR